MSTISQTRRSWWILVAMCLASFLINVDFSAVNLALAAIAKELHSTLSAVQWVVNIYLILGAALMVFFGTLSDLYGSKRIFLLGLFLFLLASVLAALSYTTWQLVLSRAIQGVGLAIVYPASAAITFNAFPESKRGLALGIFFAISGFSLSIGPSLGGLLLHLFNWPAIFWFNIPICLLSMVMAYYLIRNVATVDKAMIDFRGAALLFVGLLLIMLALNEGQNWGIISSYFWGCLLLGCLILGYFYWIEKQAAFPLIDFALFKNHNYATINLIRFLLQYISLTTLVFSSLLLQNILGYSALIAGLFLLVLTAFWGLLSPLGGKLINLVGARTPLIFGSVCLMLGCGLLAQINSTQSPVLVISAFVLIGIAFGLIFPGTIYVNMSNVPAAKTSLGNSITYTTGLIGSALGVALSGGILLYCANRSLTTLLAQYAVSLEASLYLLLQRAATGTLPLTNLANHFSADQADWMMTAAKTSFLQGFSTVNWVCTVAAFSMLLLSLRIK